MRIRDSGGFTLIETVIGLAIMAMMVAAVSELFVSNINSLALGKARASGLGVANQQIEYLRSLPYASIATQGGTIYPPGSIADTQTISRDGLNFTLKTVVNYVDDPYDGNAAGTISGKPVDLAPADYKRATVTVYLLPRNKQVAQLTTDIAARSESSATNTGVLSISIIDASGLPVQGATVTITNTTPSPAVNISTTSDNYGLVVVPNLPPDSGNHYQVTASLDGYSTSQTIPDPAGTQTAVLLSPNVLVQQVTSLTLGIDRLSTLKLSVKDTAGSPVATQAITVTGSKKTMQTPDVYKYNQASTTDSSGNITLPNMEWDSYSFTPPTGYYIITSSPYAPYPLAPNTTPTINLVLSTNAALPRITSVAPITGSVATGTVAVTIKGVNLPTGSTVKLKKSGSSDISATSVVSSGGNTQLTMNFSLVGAAQGNWDIAVTSGSNTTTQPGGFSVTP
jgi:type II secretory pathway pseudopilin PulG